jgi:hypothetical protein
MALPRLRVETTFMRGFAKSYIGETSFTPRAEEDMRCAPVSLVDVHQALRSGWVVESEKEDAHGVLWTMDGNTADDDPLRLYLEVHCQHYRVCILRVSRIAGSSND